MSTQPAIVKVAQPDAPGVVDHPRPDRLVRGNPRRQTWSLYESGDGVSSVGIWTCEPGMWRIAFAPNKEEYFFVLEGHVRLHDESGLAVDVRAGEGAVMTGRDRPSNRPSAPVQVYKGRRSLRRVS